MSEGTPVAALPGPAWTAGAASDAGLVRGRNEDRFWMDDARGVFLVVDGLGGHAAGELAAETAVQTIRESLLEGSPAALAPQCPEARVRRAIACANNRIFELAQEAGERKGMACVLTLALVEDKTITIGHVGDSRLYLIWKSAIRKLTSDHSPVGEVEDSGELSEEEAMLHPRRNEVFRDVGSRRREPDDADFVEIRQCRFHSDAAILLCSDGLTDRLTSARVREIVDRYDGDATRVAAELVDAANRAGGQDNITALLVAGAEFRGRHGITRPRLGAGRETAPFSAKGAPMGEGEAVCAPGSRTPFLRGRVAFLTYGILIGMLLWIALRAIAKGAAQ